MWKKGQALVPSWIAFAVVGLLEQHFGRLVDYDFTAAMEDELDAIAAGRPGPHRLARRRSTSAARRAARARSPGPAG